MSKDYASALEQQLEQRQLRRQQRGSVERIHSRKSVEQVVLETFELVGGLTRYAQWANDPANYEAHLSHWMKMAPKDLTGAAVQGATIIYNSNVPASPLNRPPLGGDARDSAGFAVDQGGIEDAEFTVTDE